MKRNRAAAVRVALLGVLCVSCATVGVPVKPDRPVENTKEYGTTKTEVWQALISLVEDYGFGLVTADFEGGVLTTAWFTTRVNETLSVNPRYSTGLTVNGEQATAMERAKFTGFVKERSSVVRVKVKVLVQASTVAGEKPRWQETYSNGKLERAVLLALEDALGLEDVLVTPAPRESKAKKSEKKKKAVEEEGEDKGKWVDPFEGSWLLVPTRTGLAVCYRF